MTDPLIEPTDPDHQNGVYCGEPAHCGEPYPGALPGTPYLPQPTETMIAAAHDGYGIRPDGDLIGAIRAVLAVLARDYTITPKQAAAPAQQCSSCGAWYDPPGSHACSAPTYTTPGARHCRCKYLGVNTPEHDASALCVSLRPDADRDPEQAPKVATGCLTCHGDIGLWNPPKVDSGYTHIRPGGGPDWDLNKAHAVVPGDFVPFPPEWNAAAPMPSAFTEAVNALAREHLSPEAIADRMVHGDRSVPDGPRGLLAGPRLIRCGCGPTHTRDCEHGR